ncbi:hypothetical protein DFH27DRAFT_523012 [Peziza echinospora]|nr:hypothetical protein DFH27DRAFT_523012 [Peziza echinospora]
MYPFRFGMGAGRRESEAKGHCNGEAQALRLDTSVKDNTLRKDEDAPNPYDELDGLEFTPESSPSENTFLHTRPRRAPTPPPLGSDKRRETLHEIVTPTSNSNRRGGSSSEPPQTPIAPPPPHQHHRQPRKERPPLETPTTQYHQSQFTEHFHGLPPAPYHTPSRSSSGNIFAKNLDYNIPFGLLTPTDPSPHGSPNQLESTLSIPPPQSLSHLNISLILSLVKICIDADIPPSKHAEAEAFAKQSIFYCLSCPEALAKSFVATTSKSNLKKTSGEPGLDIDPMTTDKAFRIMTRKWEATVMKSMWKGLEDVYKYKSVPNRAGTPTPGVEPAKSTATQPRQHMLDDYTATRMLMISLHILAAMLPREGSYLPRPFAREEEWLNMRTVRGRGLVTLDIGDCFENELAERLMKRTVRALDYRIDQAQFRTKPGEENIVVALFKGYLVKCAKAELEVFKGDNSTAATSLAVMAKFGLLDKKAKVAKNWSFAGCIVEWARAVVLKSWEGGEEIKRGTVTAGGLNLMRLIYDCKKSLYLDEETFITPIFSDRLDPKEVPVQWFKAQPLDSQDRTTSLHLLSHPFLFPPSVIVTYFRAINLHLMTTAYESALNALSLMRHVSLNDYFPATKEIRDNFVEDKLRMACTTYLLLGIRREHIMEDAFNGVYRREQRELIKPLKVKFLDSGEEGVDQGGPQYEFFNVLMKEVMSPEYGMFVDTDNINHVNWFAIDQFEYLHKYELLGVLIGIAVYNGITLPVNFPMVFYKWMLEGVLDDPNEPDLELEDLEDGWPELVRGLKELLEWKDGDVEDIFVRTYEFSYNTCGGGVDSVDMIRARQEGWRGLSKPKTESRDKGKGKAQDEPESTLRETTSAPVPQPEPISSLDEGNSSTDAEAESSSHNASTIYAPAESTPESSESPQDSTPPPPPQEDYTIYDEAPMVTNANRVQFVHDYIHFLTRYSVSPQLLSLRNGLLKILPPKSLRLLTPPKFKSLVEGIQLISIPLLQQITKYDDGYHANHPVIQELWSEVGKFSQDEVKAFLEFVTASDRIPVNGLESLTFVVQRNGGDTELLPTSMTCFGRLLLPEYKVGKGKVGEKLKRALENSKGFGIV